MNREETIKWLESLKTEIGKSEHRTLWHYAEAIDMAIEALTNGYVVYKEYKTFCGVPMEEAIEVIGKYKEQTTSTIPMFKESEEAYKAWTGEEIGKDIKTEQKKVGAVADGIVGYETIQKKVEKAKEKFNRPNGRLIDRHILIEELQKATEKETSPTIRAGLIRAQRIALKVPAVSADRPHGEWINRENCQVDEDAYEVATCSNCKSEITIEYPHDNFCPNCGADMRGEQC